MIPGRDPFLDPDVLDHDFQRRRHREGEQGTRETQQSAADQRADDDRGRREVHGVFHDSRHEPIVFELLVHDEVHEDDHAAGRRFEERDDNGGRQLAARAVLRPAPQLALGASLSRGAYLDRSLSSVLDADSNVEDGVQQAVGIDGEYSAGRFLGRTELIWTRWTVPMRGPQADLRLDETALLAEALYRILPGLHLAGRAERLGFNRLQTSVGPQSWDAPVRRFEVGGAYSLIRNVIVKAAWQRNLRPGGLLGLPFV